MHAATCWHPLLPACCLALLSPSCTRQPWTLPPHLPACPLSQALLRRPALDPGDLPLLPRLLTSGTPQNRRERQWALGLMAAGLQVGVQGMHAGTGHWASWLLACR